LSKTKQQCYMYSFAGNFFPHVYIEPDVLKMSELLEANDQMQRALRIRRKASAENPEGKS
jgi:hypothetical protein